MIEIDNKKIGNRIKELRIKAGLTNEELTDELNEYCNIDERTIRRYQSGASLPKLEYLIYIADYFQVNLDYIVFGKEMSDDNSYEWKDTFKRLNRLIFCMCAAPYKIEDPQSPFNNKYLLLCLEEEMCMYLDRLNDVCRKINYEINSKHISMKEDIKKFDLIIDEFFDLNGNCNLSMNRILKISKYYNFNNEILIESLKKSINDTITKNKINN